MVIHDQTPTDQVQRTIRLFDGRIASEAAV